MLASLNVCCSATGWSHCSLLCDKCRSQYIPTAALQLGTIFTKMWSSAFVLVVVECRFVFYIICKNNRDFEYVLIINLLEICRCFVLLVQVFEDILSVDDYTLDKMCGWIF